MVNDYSSINTYLTNPQLMTGSNTSYAQRLGAPAAAAPAGGMMGNSGLGFNLDTLQLGLSGISALGNFWNAFQANKLAKQQFQFTKDITNTNLANQIKSYNTTLEDRARSRGFVEGQTDREIADYIADNSLSR